MILLLGLAGVGKSSQGQRLAAEFGWAWLSAGQILRDSGQFQAEMARGELVDDVVVGQLVLAAVNQCEAQQQKVILDGYPRGEKQAQALAAHAELFAKVEVVFCLEASRAELKRRLMQRGRADDTEEAIDKRLAAGSDLVYDVIEVLAAHGAPVEKIDGEGTREEVFERLRAAVIARQLV